jgi:hypothetical protein
MSVSIDVDEVGRREKVGRELRLLINDVVIPISHQRTVVCVEELLHWLLW